ncbi:DUF3631 domain-containing protein [Mycobacterium sp. 1245805.9]|uniref:DUF3631 domain-containing protein n=1 Tax=Mycobacterium sp. 1245805.9 TaxID=1856862 RepID=UPI0007FFFD03|nr:DUF3631 domain-containing protein [Mycobacterium sp. 1245805.9]OBI90965.1 hypothetical protein A9X00_18235 [Mycobacterium sp. 1245805.9]
MIAPEEFALDTAMLLEDIEAFLDRFVVYPSIHARRAHTLWIAHTHLMECWESTPRIAFLSPEPGSGKSRALEVTEPLVPRPIHSVNTTPAYLFRKVSDEAGLPTILYDEVDTVFGKGVRGNGDTEGVRGMINAGHRKGATAGRCVVRGKLIETEELAAYCPVALAGLNDLPDTLMSRSVVVRMRRRTAEESIEPWRPRINGPEAAKLLARLQEWAADGKQYLVGEDWWPKMPKGVEDRDADIWEALLAVADLAGPGWANDARVSAVTLVTDSKTRQPSLGILLLHDIKKVFARARTDKLTTDGVISGLINTPDSPWSRIRKGEAIDPTYLASKLRDYDIGPKAQRIKDDVFKGYSRAQFEDAWKRYPLPVDDEEDGGL